jgi:hypothetical protein
LHDPFFFIGLAGQQQGAGIAVMMAWPIQTKMPALIVCQYHASGIDSFFRAMKSHNAASISGFIGGIS